MGTASRIAENISKIQERIAAAAERSGRDPSEIQLLAVSKRQPVEAVRLALAAGQTEFGESYVQEADEKIAELRQTGAIWHLIGHLQRNKAGRAAALFDTVQTVDSLEIAQALGKRIAGLEKHLNVLVEVNVSGEASKSGVAPEAALQLCEEVIRIEGLRLRGLLAMGPLTTGDEDGKRATRRSFAQAAKLFEQLPAEHRQVLSMGMTGDFEPAIEEGSTMVRIGTGIFGPRQGVGY